MLSQMLKLRVDQRYPLKLVPTVETCRGKTFIVTGGNTGLGFEAVKHLANLSSAKVILASRSVDRGEAAKARIEQETGRKGIVEVWQLDLASSDSVRRFAARVDALARIEAVVLNAGIALDTWSESEGWEMTLAVNVFGTFLLAMLLLPKLKDVAAKSGINPRLSITGSSVAFEAADILEKLDGDILDKLNTKPTGPSEFRDPRYPLSKLLQLYAMRELARRHPVEQTGVIINYVNPGLCTTELSRHVNWKVRTRIGIMKYLIGRTAEEGSRTLLFAAFAPPESHGAYTSECEIREWKLPMWITNGSGQDIQLRVWDGLVKRLNEVQPGIAE